MPRGSGGFVSRGMTSKVTESLRLRCPGCVLSEVTPKAAPTKAVKPRP